MGQADNKLKLRSQVESLTQYLHSGNLPIVLSHERYFVVALKTAMPYITLCLIVCALRLNTNNCTSATRYFDSVALKPVQCLQYIMR